MALFVFRSGIPVAVPADYQSSPEHRELVGRLLSTTSYNVAVGIIEQHADTFLAADILTGAAWAQRFLNTTALTWRSGDRKTALRGLRALMLTLNGQKRQVGRHREPPLSPEALGRAAESIARWRAVVEKVWEDRATMASALINAASLTFALSAAHRRALRALMRRKRLRRQDLVLTLASWETGIPIRRLRRSAQPVADVVYG